MNWKHLKALIQLRMQLSRNQQIKVSKFNYYITRIAMALIFVQAIVSFFATAGLVGIFARAVSVGYVCKIWHFALLGLIFYWGLMVLGQLQQTETVSFEKLLHLPVSFKGAFLLNYLSSFSNSAVILGAPVLFGIAVGAILAKGAAGLGLLFATFGWLFLLSTLTYLFRGWVSRVVQNKRTKAILGITVPCVIVTVFVLLGIDTGDSSLIGTAKRNINNAVSDAMKNVPSILFITGMIVVGSASLYLSYRSLVRQYLEPKGRSTASASREKVAVANQRFMYGNVPYLSTQASSVVFATLLAIKRAPELLAALIPIIVLLVVGSPYLLQWEGFTIADYVMPWIPIGIIAITMIGFPAFIFSTFSYDRDGFRAFVLSPISRSDILLGKNVAIGFLTIVSGFFCLALFQIVFPDHLVVFISHSINLVATYLLMCPVGNFLSIYCPVGLKRGTMQPANAPFFSTVLLYLGILVAPFLLMQPAMLACGLAMLARWSIVSIDPVTYLIYSLLVLIGSVVVYYLGLQMLDRSLWYRQSKIVNIVGNLPE